ncbi:MAG: zinc ribbon domain-containing protein [Candidatus Marinimicrobia bacterium]|nr:zinc ribbon domain-containing protein [Candidatus Neomarinimicrobiota bacterium]
MPMYDYRCKQCGDKFEELIFSWNKEKEIICPNCSSKDAERLIGAPVSIGTSSRSFPQDPSDGTSPEQCCRAQQGSGFS